MRAAWTAGLRWYLGIALLGALPIGAQEASVAPLSLAEAIETALGANPRLAAARFGLEVADEQVSEAWGNVMPTLDLSSTYTRNISPAVNFLPAIIFNPDAGPDELVGVQFAADNAWALSLNLEQPLFNAAAFIGVGASGRFQALQQESVRAEVQTTVTRVREAFYGVLLVQEQVRLTEQSVERVRETLRETQALADAGLASEYDVLRLEVELANLEPNLGRARNAVRQAQRTLAVELGEDPARLEGRALAGSLASLDLEDRGANDAENRALLELTGAELPGAAGATDADQVAEVVSGFVAEAMEARADLRALRLTEDLRRTELRLEQVEYLPKVSLFGTYAINAQQNGDPRFFGSPRAYARFAGVQVTLPVFQGFRRDARADQKRAALRQAEQQTAFARLQANAEIRALVELATEARQRAAAARMAVGQATRGFEIARAQYREGLAGRIELTDAEVALRQSEFNYAQAVHDFLVTRARLDVAVGRVPMSNEVE